MTDTNDVLSPASPQAGMHPAIGLLGQVMDLLRDGPVARDTEIWNRIHSHIQAICRVLAEIKE